MKICVVGPDKLYPDKKSISVGDELKLLKEIHPKFGNTVKVFSSDTVHIGYVAARQQTNYHGCSVAQEIYDKWSKKQVFWAYVIDITYNSDGDVNLIAEISAKRKENKKEEKEEEKIMSKTEKDFKVFYAAVEGNKKMYPNRYIPLKSLKKGIAVAAKMQSLPEDGKTDVLIEVDGEWVPCGYISPNEHTSTDASIKKAGGLKTDKVLAELLSRYKSEGEEAKTECSLTSVLDDSDFLGVCLEVKVFGETAMEAAAKKIKESSDLSEDSFNEINTWLSSLNLSEKVIQKVFNMAAVDGLPQNASRIPAKTAFNNYDEVTEDVIFSIVSNSNTMLSGPMAAGKNTCLESIAYYFKKALYEIQVNSYIDNDVLLGTRTISAKENAAEKKAINEEGMKLIQAIAGLSNKADLKAGIERNSAETVEAVEAQTGIDFSLLINAMKNGETEVSFQPSVLVKAMEEGSFLVIDEFNTGQPSVMAVLNSVLDDRKRIQVPGYGLVKAAPGFRVFATMNPDYEGTFALNPATSSRFNHVMFRAADSITPIILSRVATADKTYLKAAEKLYKKIRKGIEDGNFQSESVNVRGFIEAAKMVELGRSVKQSMLVCVANGVTDLDDRKAIKDYIDVDIA